MTIRTDEDLVKQPLLEHLKELKRRVIYSLLAFFAATCVSYYFAEDIYAFLVKPLAQAVPEEQGRRMIYTGLAEAFLTYLKLSVFAGFLFSFPVIAGQFYLFLAPGLYKNEQRAIMPYLVAAPLLFIAGAAFVYYLIFPAAWSFFLGFESVGASDSLPIQLEAKVSDYLSLVTHLIVAFGLAFQLPVILVLLVRSGIMKLDSLKKGRRYAIVIIVAVAAIITPPDIFSQIALSIPLYMLYEISIILCRNAGSDSSN
ncbi:MAG: twin-arginine translocase subunit TatC [Rickettsiales bacterium]